MIYNSSLPYVLNVRLSLFQHGLSKARLGCYGQLLNLIFGPATRKWEETLCEDQSDGAAVTLFPLGKGNGKFNSADR